MNPGIKEEIGNFFDFILIATDEEQESHIEIEVKNQGTLKDWYKELDHYQYEEEKEMIDWGDQEPIEDI